MTKISVVFRLLIFRFLFHSIKTFIIVVFSRSVLVSGFRRSLRLRIHILQWMAQPLCQQQVQIFSNFESRFEQSYMGNNLLSILFVFSQFLAVNIVAVYQCCPFVRVSYPAPNITQRLKILLWRRVKDAIDDHPLTYYEVGSSREVTSQTNVTYKTDKKPVSEHISCVFFNETDIVSIIGVFLQKVKDAVEEGL